TTAHLFQRAGYFYAEDENPPREILDSPGFELGGFAAVIFRHDAATPVYMVQQAPGGKLEPPWLPADGDHSTVNVDCALELPRLLPGGEGRPRFQTCRPSQKRWWCWPSLILVAG